MSVVLTVHLFFRGIFFKIWHQKTPRTKQVSEKNLLTQKGLYQHLHVGYARTHNRTNGLSPA